MNNDSKINEIAGKLLGKKGGEGYSSLYDPSLLVKVPRQLNREIYNIEEDSLPFVGFDIWNGYEVTALTEKGLPIAGVMKISIPCNSKYHPESKSIKMYVNSFAMTKYGKTEKECIKWIEDTVRKDLADLLELELQQVGVKIFTHDEDELKAKNTFLESRQCVSLDDAELDNVEFTEYKMNPDLLEDRVGRNQLLYAKTNKLRSACRVTHQPDHGSVYVYMNADTIPTRESLLKFIVSFRNEYHFHEEICEAIYTTLYRKYNPISLIVACNYTRRGGWDINPIRATHLDLIPTEWALEYPMLKKTIKQ